MIEVELNAVEILIASFVGNMRQSWALRKGQINAHGFKGDDWETHIQGALGECAFAKGVGVHWDMSTNRMKDGPPDFPPDIEIRTRAKDHYGLLIRQGAHGDRAYVLVTGKNGSYRIHGWCLGREKSALGREWDFNSPGRPLAYLIEQDQLHSLGGLNLEGLPRC